MENDNILTIHNPDESPETAFVIARGLMIPAVKIFPNTGQFPGVPANHMGITEQGVNDLRNSLTEDPEFLFANPLTVIPYGDDTFVVFAGNQRLREGSFLGIKEFPCDVLNPHTDVNKLKRFILKDNINYGYVDYDVLANEWDFEIDELQHMGLYFPDIEIGPDPDEEKAADKEPEVKLTLSFTGNLDQFDRIKAGIEKLITGYDAIKLK